MKKEELATLVDDYGDAVITYRSENSNKLKYNVCTLDFSTPYIQKKKNRAKESEKTQNLPVIPVIAVPGQAPPVCP